LAAVKLYDFRFAPNPIRVRVYLAEKGISIPVVPVNLLAREHKAPDFLARNPLGALPVLELDDGTCLSESLAIIEYLEELHPRPPMIGSEPLERARVRALERIAELGVLHRVARVLHHTRAPLGNAPVPEIAEEARAGLGRVLDVLDGAVAGRVFVAGERPTIADCTLCAAFRLAEFCELPLDAGRADLARWWGRFRQRPSASA
jgi:glutathione S-transferase